MRVAVYNRFWPTLGGGEKLAAAIGQALAADHDVTLLTHGPLDLDLLAERLGLDLRGLQVEQVPDRVVSVSAASRHYDLFVNASYDSVVPPRSRWAIQVVYFPETERAGLAPLRRRLGALGRALRGDRPIVHPLSGLHGPQRSGRHLRRRTDGDASWEVEVGPDERVPIRIALDHEVAPPGPVEVTLERAAEPDEGDGVPTVLARARLDPDGRGLIPRSGRVLRGMLEGLADGSPAELRLRTSRSLEGFNPLAAGSGVAVTNVVAGAGIRHRVAAVLPVLWVDDPIEELLARTDRIVAISAFTQRWITRRWGCPSQVLHPPVTLFEPRPKEAIILSVGRFFPPDALHSKHQLEMVEAFASLLTHGGEGWELHLVGGCAPEHRSYLEEVERRAAGLPVRFHVDAPGSLVADLNARASIYWHAAGLGVDEEQHPRHVEHFGIATAEAMSAGAVPVVVAAGGQVEVVEDGVSGIHVRSVTELVERTAGLIADPDRRAVLADGARARAEDFRLETFLDGVRGLVADVTSRSR